MRSAPPMMAAGRRDRPVPSPWHEAEDGEPLTLLAPHTLPYRPLPDLPRPEAPDEQ